jgi:hypothetical protein
MREFLVSTAKANGRSITQEGEILLEYGRRDEARLEGVFDLAYGPWLAGALMAIGHAMQEAGRDSYFAQAVGKVNIAAAGPTAVMEELQNWMNNPNAFNQSVKAAMTILDAIRPEGDYQSTTEIDPALYRRRSDSNAAVALEDFALEPSAVGHAAGLRVLKAITQPSTTSPAIKRHRSIIREKLGDGVVARIDGRVWPPEGDKP